jgi:hypothetical protein
MSKSFVDFSLNTVEEVLEVPFNIVRNNVIEPLVKVDVKMFLALSLVLMFVSFILTEWKSAPKSCKVVVGACYKIFKGKYESTNDSGQSFAGVYELLRSGLEIIFLVLVFKLVARGVQSHGIKPIAFLSLAAVLGLAEALHVLLTDLFIVALPDNAVFQNQNAGQDASFKKICQIYLYYVINRFRFSSTDSLTPVAILAGVIAGSLA